MNRACFTHTTDPTLAEELSEAEHLNNIILKHASIPSASPSRFIVPLKTIIL
jgi:hypothetical protein